MTEKGKLFFEKISKDEKLKAELAEFIKDTNKDTCFDKTLDFAKANGFDIDKDDLKTDKEELDPEELEMVTGGGGCGCAAIGHGGGDGLVCGCTIVGVGTVDGLNITSQGGCVCAAAGAGATNLH